MNDLNYSVSRSRSPFTHSGRCKRCQHLVTCKKTKPTHAQVRWESKSNWQALGLKKWKLGKDPEWLTEYWWMIKTFKNFENFIKIRFNFNQTWLIERPLLRLTLVQFWRKLVHTFIVFQPLKNFGCQNCT